MAVVTLERLKAQLGWTWSLADEDALLADKIAAAQGYVERLLGYAIESRFGGVDQDPVPPALAEAILQLAAWWFENREAVNEGSTVNEVPFGVTAIVREYCDWVF